jgi:hypothetical protein
MTRRFGAFLIASTLGLVSCQQPPPPAPFQIFVRVDSDPGRPVEGASITHANKVIGTTNAEGRAMLTFPGAEGEIADVLVMCPEGFQSPTKALSLRLTRLADKTKVPEYSVACPPTMRRVVVAVRADNGPNLPVVYLNRAVGRTDGSGAAHFALEVAPGSQFQVQLDTGDRKDLKPQKPTKAFVVNQQDDILLFDQKFTVERKIVRAPKGPSIPRPISR